MKGKILIADDDPLLAKMLEITLTQENYITYTLPDGQKVLEKIHQINPDVIIADIMMPGMDGYELYRCLRKDPATAFIPFVFLSAKTSLLDQLEGFRMGADDFVCKPFKLEDLIVRLQRVIQQAARTRFFNIRADFSGNLTQMKIADIIQLIELNYKTGELSFKNSKGKQIGKAFFKNGNLIHSQTSLLKGEEAFYELMGEINGYFEFYMTSVDTIQTITIPNMSVLLNGTRIIDEASGIAEFIPDADCHLSIKSKEVSSALENKLGAKHINYIFELIEHRVSFPNMLNSDKISKYRALSVIINLFKEDILEVQQNFTDTNVQMDKDLLLKIQEANIKALSGVLKINNGSLKASIYFQQGEIIHALYGMASGKKALFKILSQTPWEINFFHESLSEIKSIQIPINNLLINAKEEIKCLKMIDKHLFEHYISINLDRLNKITNTNNRNELTQIINLAKKHKKIRDVIEASRYTDLETFKVILELNNLNIIDIQKNPLFPFPQEG
jgi:DNA-binding response OmpR family regulator